MSTTETTPNLTEPTTSDVAVKSENMTYRRFASINSEGKVDDSKTKLSSSDKTVETLKDNKEYQLAGAFTVKYYSVGSQEGFESLIPDAEERVNIINKGIAAKFNAKVSGALKEFDETKNEFVFAETAEPIDTIEWLREPTNRKLSPLEKSLTGLAASTGLDLAALRQMIANMAAGNQAQG